MDERGREVREGDGVVLGRVFGVSLKNGFGVVTVQLGGSGDG